MRPFRPKLTITVHPDLHGYTGAVRDGRLVRHLTDPQPTEDAARQAAKAWACRCRTPEPIEPGENGAQ